MMAERQTTSAHAGYETGNGWSRAERCSGSMALVAGTLYALKCTADSIEVRRADGTARVVASHRFADDPPWLIVDAEVLQFDGVPVVVSLHANGPDTMITVFDVAAGRVILAARFDDLTAVCMSPYVRHRSDTKRNGTIYVALGTAKHGSFLLNTGMRDRAFRSDDLAPREGRLSDLAPLTPRGDYPVTCVRYLENAEAIAIGYEQNGFQLVTTDYGTVFTEEIRDGSRILDFVLQEPENDPKAVLYLWVISDFPHGPLGVTGTIYQLLFALSEFDTRRAMNVYTNLTQLGPTLVHRWPNRKFLSGKVIVDPKCNVDSRVSVDDSSEAKPGLKDTTYAAFSMISPDGAISVTLFDMNAWYLHRMACTPLFKDPKRRFLAIYPLAEDVSRSAACLDVWVDPDSIAKFPWYHTHGMPILSFDVVVFLEHSILHVQVKDDQTEFLSRITPVEIFNDPEQVVQIAGSHGLLSPDVSIRSEPAGLSQVSPWKTELGENRFKLLHMLLQKGSMSVLCRMLAADDVDLDLIGRWLWDEAKKLKHHLLHLGERLFSTSLTEMADAEVQQVNAIGIKVQRVLSLANRAYVLLPTKCKEQTLLKESKDRLEALKLFAGYVAMVVWFMNHGLLPEGRFPVNVQISEHYDEVRRNSISDVLLIDEFLRENATGCRDFWISEHGWESVYPPPSLNALLSTFLLPDVSRENKLLLAFYALLDILNHAPEQEVYELSKSCKNFALEFMMPVHATFADFTRAMWYADNEDTEASVQSLYDAATCVTGDQDLSAWMGLWRSLRDRGICSDHLNAVFASEKERLERFPTFAWGGLAGRAAQRSFLARLVDMKEFDILISLPLDSENVKMLDELVFERFKPTAQNPGAFDVLTLLHMARGSLVLARNYHQQYRCVFPGSQPHLSEASQARICLGDQLVKILPDMPGVGFSRPEHGSKSGGTPRHALPVFGQKSTPLPKPEMRFLFPTTDTRVESDFTPLKSTEQSGTSSASEEAANISAVFSRLFQSRRSDTSKGAFHSFQNASPAVADLLQTPPSVRTDRRRRNVPSSTSTSGQSRLHSILRKGGKAKAVQPRHLTFAISGEDSSDRPHRVFPKTISRRSVSPSPERTSLGASASPIPESTSSSDSDDEVSFSVPLQIGAGSGNEASRRLRSGIRASIENIDDRAASSPSPLTRVTAGKRKEPEEDGPKEAEPAVVRRFRGSFGAIADDRTSESPGKLARFSFSVPPGQKQLATTAEVASSRIPGRKADEPVVTPRRPLRHAAQAARENLHEQLSPGRRRVQESPAREVPTSPARKIVGQAAPFAQPPLVGREKASTDSDMELTDLVSPVDDVSPDIPSSGGASKEPKVERLVEAAVGFAAASARHEVREDGSDLMDVDDVMRPDRESTPEMSFIEQDVLDSPRSAALAAMKQIHEQQHPREHPGPSPVREDANSGHSLVRGDVNSRSDSLEKRQQRNTSTLMGKQGYESKGGNVDESTGISDGVHGRTGAKQPDPTVTYLADIILKRQVFAGSDPDSDVIKTRSETEQASAEVAEGVSPARVDSGTPLSGSPEPQTDSTQDDDVEPSDFFGKKVEAAGGVESLAVGRPVESSPEKSGDSQKSPDSKKMAVSKELAVTVTPTRPKRHAAQAAKEILHQQLSPGRRRTLESPCRKTDEPLVRKSPGRKSTDSSGRKIGASEKTGSPKPLEPIPFLSDQRKKVHSDSDMELTEMVSQVEPVVCDVDVSQGSADGFEGNVRESEPENKHGPLIENAPMEDLAQMGSTGGPTNDENSLEQNVSVTGQKFFEKAPKLTADNPTTTTSRQAIATNRWMSTEEEELALLSDLDESEDAGPGQDYGAEAGLGVVSGVLGSAIERPASPQPASDVDLDSQSDTEKLTLDGSSEGEEDKRNQTPERNETSNSRTTEEKSGTPEYKSGTSKEMSGTPEKSVPDDSKQSADRNVLGMVVVSSSSEEESDFASDDSRSRSRTPLESSVDSDSDSDDVSFNDRTVKLAGKKGMGFMEDENPKNSAREQAQGTGTPVALNLLEPDFGPDSPEPDFGPNLREPDFAPDLREPDSAPESNPGEGVSAEENSEEDGVYFTEPEEPVFLREAESGSRKPNPEQQPLVAPMQKTGPSPAPEFRSPEPRGSPISGSEGLKIRNLEPTTSTASSYGLSPVPTQGLAPDQGVDLIFTCQEPKTAPDQDMDLIFTSPEPRAHASSTTSGSVPSLTPGSVPDQAMDLIFTSPDPRQHASRGSVPSPSPKSGSDHGISQQARSQGTDDMSIVSVSTSQSVSTEESGGGKDKSPISGAISRAKRVVEADIEYSSPIVLSPANRRLTDVKTSTREDDPVFSPPVNRKKPAQSPLTHSPTRRIPAQTPDISTSAHRDSSLLDVIPEEEEHRPVSPCAVPKEHSVANEYPKAPLGHTLTAVLEEREPTPEAQSPPKFPPNFVAGLPSPKMVSFSFSLPEESGNISQLTAKKPPPGGLKTIPEDSAMSIDDPSVSFGSPKSSPSLKSPQKSSKTPPKLSKTPPKSSKTSSRSDRYRSISANASPLSRSTPVQLLDVTATPSRRYNLRKRGASESSEQDHELPPSTAKSPPKLPEKPPSTVKSPPKSTKKSTSTSKSPPKSLKKPPKLIESEAEDEAPSTSTRSEPQKPTRVTRARKSAPISSTAQPPSKRRKSTFKSFDGLTMVGSSLPERPIPSTSSPTRLSPPSLHTRSATRSTRKEPATSEDQVPPQQNKIAKGVTTPADRRGRTRQISSASDHEKSGYELRRSRRGSSADPEPPKPPASRETRRRSTFRTNDGNTLVPSVDQLSDAKRVTRRSTRS